MRPVADTSFLIALLDAGDPHGEMARKLVDLDGPPAACDVTIAETLQVVRFKARKLRGEAAGRRESRQAMRSLLDHLRCSVEPAPAMEETRALFEAHAVLSWPDAVVLAQSQGRTLWTFDEAQRALHR